MYSLLCGSVIRIIVLIRKIVLKKEFLSIFPFTFFINHFTSVALQLFIILRGAGWKLVQWSSDDSYDYAVVFTCSHSTIQGLDF